METTELKVIITVCLQKKRDAQKLLYKTFYGFAMGICIRYSGNRDEAANILNQGFIKVFVELQHHESCNTFKSWLSKIMVNASINYHGGNFQLSTFIERKTDLVIMNIDFADYKLTYNELLGMIQQLSLESRIVFNLYAIDSYSHENIAKMLNIDIDTSKANLFNAREKLKNMISDERIL